MINVRSFILIAGIFLGLSITKVGALPVLDGDTGIKYHATLHEQGEYNGYAFYRKDYARKYWWADQYLNKLSFARYNAIDKPLKDLVTAKVNEYAANEGLDIKTLNVATHGHLNASFDSTGTNKLGFVISGLRAEVHAKFKKSWYAEGWVHASLDNLSISGEYNYFNGQVTITGVDAPFDVDVDVDLNIPLIGDLFDFIIDDFVDGQLSELPTNLNQLMSGGESFSLTIAGIQDFIPLGVLVYNGVDYGAELLDKLSRENIINDNFSFTIGGIVAQQQYFDVTIGNFTYKRWTTGGKQYCTISPMDPNCEPGF